MPRKPRFEKRPAEILAPIPAEILDQIVRDGPLTAADVDTATRRFKKALIERALGAELTHHLGYSPGDTKPELTTNHCNGTSRKRVLADDGPVSIEVPRDREGTFEPQLAQSALDAFELSDWGQRFPTIVAAWRRAWTRVVPFFAFPPEIRRARYTTNALESVHAQLRKIIKTRGHFPTTPRPN